MCDQYLVRTHKAGAEPQEDYCDTYELLATALGMQPADLGEPEGDVCLCGIDHDELQIAAMPRALSIRRATQEEGFPFPSWIIEVAA